MKNDMMVTTTTAPLEALKHLTTEGQEYWSARELAALLGYIDYRHFWPVVRKAKLACQNSHQPLSLHFIEHRDKRRKDPHLSRYACYLIIQNGNPVHFLIAQGQTYFATQTRKQELRLEVEAQQSSEDQKRLFLRHVLYQHNKNLAAAAKAAGVKTADEYSTFQNHGYEGLYGGLNAKAIHQKKGLKPSYSILDYMGSTELSANLFRATQTEEKLKRGHIQDKQQANYAHYRVGAKVRQTIEELGGALPEQLPSPTKSIRQLARGQEKFHWQ